MLMLFPLRVDAYLERTPLANYCLLGFIAIISIWAWKETDVLLWLSGIEIQMPSSPWGKVEVYFDAPFYAWPRYALTSAFAHGGILHLAGNLWFLWVFGNAINSKFGHAGFLGLWVLAAVGGGMAHYAATGEPAIGASGAVYGVMGAFLVFFPRNRVDMVAGVWFFRPLAVRHFEIASGWIIAGWVVWDFAAHLLGMAGRIAVLGHIGGFLAGFVTAMLLACTGIIRPTQDEQTLVQILRREPMRG